MVAACSAIRPLSAPIVGPFDRHCAAAPLHAEAAYVVTPFIATAAVPIAVPSIGATLLDRTIAFDAAEASVVNITQTNLIQVSSFCGPNGLLLGHDILPQSRHGHRLLSSGRHPNVYDLEPLVEAASALYGTVAAPRFPIMPGQHLLCAYKSIFAEGPCVLYGSLAVAMPEDRTKQAGLFMEDLGVWPDASDGPLLEAFKEQALERLIDSVRRVGDNVGVRYALILVGIRSISVAAGEIGCALTAAPYVQLARQAVPDGRPESLRDMRLQDWQSLTDYQPSS